MKLRTSILAAATVISLSATGFSATVTVTPTSMGNWGLFTTDNATNNPGSGSHTGTAAIVSAPPTPTDGAGQVQLATGAGHGDESAQLRFSGAAGTAIADLTTLSYSTYCTASNDSPPSQDTFFKFYLSNGDEIVFEPIYGDGHDVTNPNGSQAVPSFNVWQNWNLLHGMWYSDNGNFGTSPGEHSVSWQTIVADEGPGVTIVNPGANPLGGVRIAAGYASASDDFNVYVDDFSIGTAAGSTTYNFEPAAAVPLPKAAYAGLGLIAGLALLGAAKRRRRVLA